MPTFIFAYHGGKTPETEEEGAAEMAAWRAWFAAMEAAVVDGGNPVGMSRTVTAEGVAENGGANPLSGYTLVQAADHTAACELAKECPMVRNGTGSVEVAEVIDLGM